MYNSYDIRQLFVKLLIYQGVILITFLFTYYFFLIIFFKNPQLIADQGQIVQCIAQWDYRVYLPSFLTLYINIRMVKHVLCVSNILQIHKRYIIGMEFLSGVYYLPVPDLFGERSMILDPICFLLFLIDMSFLFYTGIHVRSQTRAFFHTRIFLLFESTMCIKLHG